MGMFEKFPYRNTRDLNLNWIIKKIIYLEEVVGKAVSDVATFLSKKGGKMEGPIDMQNNRIFNLPTPAGDTDATSKKYVDDKTRNYLPLAGGTMTGAVNMGGNKITSVATPEADADVATKKYVDDHSGGVSGDYLPLAGGTMTGPINMNGQHISGLNDPSEDTQAARKGYVDAAKAEANAYTDTKADLPKTVSGTVAAMSDASSGPLQDLRIYGRTTQDGTPTPDNPIPLVSVGDGGSVGVMVLGAQLADNRISGVVGDPIYSINGNYATYKNTSGSQCRVNLKGRSLPAGTYTAYVRDMLITNSGLVGIGINGVSVKWLSQNEQRYVFTLEDKANVSITLTTPNLTTIGNFSCYFGIVSGDVPLNDCPKVDKVPDEQMMSISTPNGLPGIRVTSGGNYTDSNGQLWICDEVDFARGVYVQRIGTIDSYAGEAVTEPYLSTTGALSTGAKVLYVLATPIETQIREDELAAYAALHTNKPNTTIYNDAGAHMDVGYYTPNSTMRQSDIEKSMSEKLSKTGGTMTGAINMGSKKITNVADPEAAQDVATKKYVDAHSGGGVSGDYLPLSGGTMSGPVDMGNQKITNVPDPTANQDVATKKYVDENSGSVKEITYGQITLYGFRYTATQCQFRIYLPFSVTAENVNFENFSPYGLKIIDSNGTQVSLTITETIVRVQAGLGNIVDIVLAHSANTTLANKMNLYAKAELQAGFTVKKI